MTYDKDIRVCRNTMIVLGVLMVVGVVINLLVRNWIVAGSFALWTWACWISFRTAETHQRSRDETRSAMADMMRTWANTLPSVRVDDGLSGYRRDAAVDAMDKAYGYKTYKCPKCGRLSHLPKEVEPYCIECLAESARLMNRQQMLLRAGFYSGVAGRLLNDYSYAARWLGRAEEITEADYLVAVQEIQSRLVAGGFIAPDEDPYRTIYVYER